LYVSVHEVGPTLRADQPPRLAALLRREYPKNGGDLASLADYMGHADVQVTHASYAIFRTEELKTKHTKHSPLAHLRETRH
jgi:integrase